MVTCPEIESRFRAVVDPLHHLDTDGGVGPNFETLRTDPQLTPFGPPIVMDYRVHLGPPALPYRRPLVRRPTNASEAAIVVWLISLYYNGRDALRLCPYAQGLYHTAGRADALTKLSKYLASERKNPVALDAIASGTLQAAILQILDDPTGGRNFGKDTSVVASATEVIDADRRFDRAVWLPLWGWALGGPTGTADVRTRVFAMKTLQTILDRGGLFPAEVRAADPMAEVLRRLVVARAPSVPAAERDWYLAEAQSLVGAIAKANAAAVMAEAAGAGTVPLPPPTGVIPAWIPIGGALAAASLLLAVVATR